MILPVACHILRRLQNTIYPPQPPEEMQQTATIEEGNGSISTMEIDHEPTFDSRSLDLANFNFSRRMNSNDSSSSLPEEPSTYILTPNASSPSQDTSSTRDTLSTHSRSRQSSGPLICIPDVNAQTVLRKRILEIQSLNIPEREKARLVQVAPPFLMVT